MMAFAARACEHRERNFLVGAMFAAALVLLLVASSSGTAQTGSSEDPLAGPVCHDRTTFERALNARSGHVLIGLEGAGIRDTGRDVAVDVGETFHWYFLATYRHADSGRWTLVRSIEPVNRNPPRLCAVAGGAGRMAFADARANRSGIDSNLGGFESGRALDHCRSIRPVVDRLISGRLQRFGGAVVTNLEYSETLERMVGGDIGASRRKNEERLRAVEAVGDHRCHRLEPLLALARDQDNCRLVGQVSGEEFAVDGTRHVAAFSFLFCDEAVYRSAAVRSGARAPGEEAWRLLKTFQSGASFPWADGPVARANAAWFAQLGATQ